MIRKKQVEQITGRTMMKKEMRFDNKQILACLIYWDRSEESIIAYMHTYSGLERGEAEVSVFCTQNLRSKDHGCGFYEQNLRSGVGVVNFTNKTCDFEPQPQPALERMRSSFRNRGEAIPTV